MSIVQRLRILIVGGGIGGLGAATALALRGFSVELVEIRGDLTAAGGVGINQPANALRAMREIGLLDQCLARGFQFDHGAHHDVTGQPLWQYRYEFGIDGLPGNNGISRADLHDILLAAAKQAGVELRFGTTVRSRTEYSDHIEVATTDGRVGRYDLLLAFDGIGSQTRHEVFGPEYRPTPTGFGVLRVTLPRPADLTGLHMFHGPGVKVGFCPTSEEKMYLHSVARQPPEGAPAQNTLHRMLHNQLTPFEGLPGEVRDSMDGTEAIVFSPISEVLLPLPWFRGRIAVLGDAAHACAPHLSQGAAMALEDGVVLAEVLAERNAPLADVLEEFGRRRFPRVRAVQEASRKILEAEMEQGTAATTVRAEGGRGMDHFLGLPA